jgi:RepB DNA-primase from phage plasmid
MLETFASVDAMLFELTQINIEGEERRIRPRLSLAQLENSLPRLFPGAAERQNNIIARASGDTVQFAQLDDLDEAKLKPVAAFLTLQTSPGNHQARVAASVLNSCEETKEFARRLSKEKEPILPLPPRAPRALT